MVEVHREVQPRYETTAILTQFERRMRSPVLLFRNIAGATFPVVTNVCGSRGRLALAMGCPLGDLGRTFRERCARPMPPEVASTGPVHENVRLGTDVDLRALPQMVYHQDDSPHPYITAAMVVVRDPESRRANLSYHRLMIVVARKTGIFMEHGHLLEVFQKHVRAGRDMPIAVILGAHPLWSLGALYSGPADVEEYDIIGGLQGRPLETVNCLTCPDLLAPSRAEFTLEGSVSINERIEEGPFGEFTGVSSGKTSSPAFNVGAMTYRNDAIFQDIVSGHAEHLLLPSLGLEARLLSVARTVVKHVRGIGMPVPLTIVVSIEKSDNNEPRRLIEKLLDCGIHVKHVVITDASVDPGNLRQVLTAVSLNTQADRDVYIYGNQQGSPCDPSALENGQTAKMGIDGTLSQSGNRSVAANAVPKEILDAVNIDAILRG